jgi:hypothetical protein
MIKLKNNINIMNKYTLGVIGIVIIAFLVFAVNTSSNKKAEKNKQVASVVTAEKTEHDFGDIDIFGGKVRTTYVLKNEGIEDVKIMSAVTSCMCTEGEIGGMKFGMHSATGGHVTISAGGEEILTAIYDPLAHGPNGTGKITRQLMLKTNSTQTPEIEVRLSANVVKNQ